MTANKRCLGTSFTVMKPLIKITRRCARPCFSRNCGLLFAQLFMLASASSPLHDLSFLIFVGHLVKFALNDFAYAISDRLLFARVGDVAALTSPCCTTGYAYLHVVVDGPKVRIDELSRVISRTVHRLNRNV